MSKSQQYINVNWKNWPRIKQSHYNKKLSRPVRKTCQKKRKSYSYKISCWKRKL